MQLVNQPIFFLCISHRRPALLDSTQNIDSLETPTVHYSDRIVGGVPAAIQYFPWQVSVTYYRQHRCGGSVISATHILTAAHCTFKSKHSNIGIRAGTAARSSGGVLRNARKVLEYPGYSHSGHDNDLSLIWMDAALPFGPTVQPIAMAGAADVPKVGAAALISGWGDLREQPGLTPQKLHFVSVPIVDRAVCTKAFARFVRITPQMLCAGYVGIGGRDACQGDSGGPLVIADKLYGIVSFGMGCARANYPGVYTSVPAYRRWIDEQMVELV